MFHLASNSGCNKGVQKQIVKPPWKMHDRVSGIPTYNEQTEQILRLSGQQVFLDVMPCSLVVHHNILEQIVDTM